ncbi:MAG: DUF4375 domain-containing protein [Archangium sp.]|nr:DUF4375 domain-containing protein [Archangium sp.]MDP3153818.1 DUF4375 domain-containing protein [Archangium sp.]MDP3571100.1 DUF4375 domain-containing protein [Archangium sp.]
MDLPDLLAWPRRADVPGMLFRRLISRHSTRGILGMSRAEQVLWLVFELCGEVSNGGVDQFFSNSSGERASLVPDALSELGQVELAATIERSLAHFPPAAARVERHLVVSALSDAARAELTAMGKQVDAATDTLVLELGRWIEAHPTEFTLANEGLAAFRPVSFPDDVTLKELLAPELAPDLAIPALYVHLARRKTALSPVERSLQLAIHAFGEISDEGGLSYLFSSRGKHAAEASVALENADAPDAAAIVERAMSVLPTPYPTDDTVRRAALAALDVDALARLSALQWELDDLRKPTIEALIRFARRERASLQ